MGLDLVDGSGERYCRSLACSNFLILSYKLTAERFLEPRP